MYALEKTQWEFPFSPTTAPRYNQSHGLDDAQALCSYFSRCYNVKRPVSFEDLDASLKGRVIEIGQHYEQNLRHSGVFGDVPASASAETPAQKAERRKDKAKMIDAVVQDLTSAVNEEAQKIQPKERPRPKRDPPELPKDVEEGKKKTKPPPECATTKLPPPQFRTEQQTTDTTVKSEPMQHEGPPPPPKRPAPQKPVKQEEKKTRKEETGGDPSSSSTKLQFRFRLQHQKENHNNQTIHHHLTDQNNRIIHLQVWRIFQIYQLHQHHLDMKDPDDALMCLVIFTGK